MLDNHGAHKTQRLSNLFRRHGITLLFTPPASSPLNAVETLWANFRFHWHRRLTQYALNGLLFPSDGESILSDIIEDDIKGGLNLSRANYGDMLRVLQGHHV